MIRAATGGGDSQESIISTKHITSSVTVEGGSCYHIELHELIGAGGGLMDFSKRHLVT
jgi:hypothetical protein